MAPPRRAGWFGTPRAIALALELTIAAAILVPTIDTLPNRAAAENLSQDQSATEWAHTVLQTVKPNAVIVSWWSYSTTLWYAQIIEGLRPDVWVVDDRTRLDDHLGGVGSVIESQLGKRPIYLIRLEQLNEIPTLEDSYELRPFQTTTGPADVRSHRASDAVTAVMPAAPAAHASPDLARAPGVGKVAELSYFFPAHNEEANLEGLVAEALEQLPALAERFEIVIVDDGSRDRTPALADGLAAANPGVVRVVHHPTNLGYGAALRSGFRASRDTR